MKLEDERETGNYEANKKLSLGFYGEISKKIDKIEINTGTIDNFSPTRWNVASEEFLKIKNIFSRAYRLVMR